MARSRTRRVSRRVVAEPVSVDLGYPVPANEAARLQALRRLAILDTPPEPAYDRITRTAQRIFAVAISNVALIDDDRQWFKSCVGADTKETGRELAFCAHAILANEVLVVPDATKDPRFCNNALVTGAPHIRFYAGAPLKTADGFFIGTLCIIDMTPRAFSKEDAAILADLAAVLTDELSRRNVVLELREEVLRSKALAKSLRCESNARQRAARDLQAILNALPAEVALLGHDGTIIAVNAAWRSFARANGLRAPDAGVGTNYFAICGAAKGRHSEEASEAEAGLRATLHGSLAEYCLEYPCHSPTEKRWFRMIAAPLKKGMDGAVVMHIDITERRVAEDKVRESLTLLRAVIEGTTDAIYAKDEQGRYLMINTVGAGLLGKSAGEVIGQHDDALFSAESAASGRILDDAIMQSDETRSYEENATAAGVTRTFLSTKGPLRDQSGKVTGLFGVSRDITQQRIAEEDLRRAKECAEAATRAKSVFLANMSHEIRTPMNGVIGMAGMLLDTPLAASQKELAETIQTSGEALLTIINDILDFSKIEAGKLEFEIMSIDLAHIVRGTLELLANQAKAKGVALRFANDTALPKRLLGDGGRLRQVLVNLLGNAIKFSPPDEVTLQIAVEHESDESATLQFRITDHGIGISPGVQARLFQAFTQADESTTRKHGGTGLGLAICKQLVTQMGGRIGVESAPNVGSTFWFTITLAKQLGDAIAADSTALELEPLVPFDSDLLHDAPPRRILVAEDNPVNQRIIAHELRKLGYTADVVGDGLEVLEALSRTPYDVILMDCRMPQLDGFETTAQIRALGGRQPYIIAITANAMRGDKEICLAAGMDGYVTKPIRAAALDAALREQQQRAQTGAVDPAVLAHLRSIDEEDAPGMFDDLVSLFTESTPNLLQLARSSVDDPQTLSMAAHTMKGSCSNFGALRMQTLCAKLEALDPARIAAEAELLIGAIEEEYRKVCEELVPHHATA